MLQGKIWPLETWIFPEKNELFCKNDKISINLPYAS